MSTFNIPMEVPVRSPHEQDIYDRIEKEKAARESKPPIPAGSIVLVDVPGSRETGGEPMTVPAIVLFQNEEHTLRLTAFHLGGLFNMWMQPEHVEVVLTPAIKAQLLELMDIDHRHFESIEREMLTKSDLDVPKLQEVLSEILVRLDALETPKRLNKQPKE